MQMIVELVYVIRCTSGLFIEAYKNKMPCTTRTRICQKQISSASAVDRIVFL